MPSVNDRTERQLESLRSLVRELLAGNAFYTNRLRAAGIDASIESIDAFKQRMPFTFKRELVDDHVANPPYGSNLTYPLERYARFCQTSGTTAAPLRWLDTHESWQAMLDCWKRVYAEAGIGSGDRGFFAFSFGPFLGFWTAFEAAAQMGMLAIPGGGMSSAARLKILIENEVDFLCCTPTYALRLAEIAQSEGIDLSRTKVRRIIVAGEPGGSAPTIRKRIELAWPGGRVFDHHGMTEVGPVTYENPNVPGVLHIMADAFIAEVIDPKSEEPVDAGAVGELVLTTLKRIASPLLRYRTGDLVRISSRSADELGTDELALEGGILGRADDMLIVRGVNIYPTAVEDVIRRFDEVVEYRATVATQRGMDDLRLEVEVSGNAGGKDRAARAQALCRRIEAAMRDAFQLRVTATDVPRDSLPRFEMKAKRWIRQ